MRAARSLVKLGRGARSTQRSVVSYNRLSTSVRRFSSSMCGPRSTYALTTGFMTRHRRGELFGSSSSPRPTWALRRFAVETINVPNMGDSVSEGTLVEWNKEVGEGVEVDDIVAIIETDKVSIEIRSPHKGVLKEQLAAIDDTLEVDAPLFNIDTEGTATVQSKAAPSSEPAASSAPAQSAAAPPPPQPAAAAAAGAPPPPSPPKPAASAAPSSSSSSGPQIINGFSREENRVPMSRMRQRIADRLKEAQNTAASLTTFNEIDMTNIIAMRNQHKDRFLQTHGVKLGFMSAFVKASVAALQHQPAVNASIEGKEIVYHNYVDVSVAVASPTGLVVPVIRNAESLSFAGIESTIVDFGKKAKNGTLTVNEMQGGTFTISNGGVFGSLMGTPILNPPQSAILGMHGTTERAVVVNGEIKIRPMMFVALTYDHRIIDGREAVLCLRRIKECIEDPARLLLDV